MKFPVPASNFVGSHRGDLAKISTAADERESEDLTLVNVVQANGFKDLRLDEMADANFGHDGDGDGLLDFLDELGLHIRVTSSWDRMLAGTRLRAMTA